MNGLRCFAFAVLVAVACAGCDSTVSFTITERMRARALEHDDPQALHAALTEIETWHGANGTRIPDLLKPGLSDATIDEHFEAMGCVAPEELRILWRWRNGHDDTGYAQWLVWYHQLLPIESARSQRQTLRYTTLFGWNQRWIPVFQFQDEWYFVECSDRARDASPVALYFIESGFSYAYLNLTTYLSTAARAMREKAVFADGDRDMKEDIAALAAIHAELNPGTSFPYYVPR